MIRSLKLAALLWLAVHCVVPINMETVAEPSLYRAEDNVKILNNDTLETELYSSEKSKLVQFINYFCGDCRRFASIFKEVARRLYEWESILSVFVVDCALERNVQICRDFDIQRTPTLRFFPPNFQRTEKQIGIDIATLIPDEIYVQLAEQISRIKYTRAGYPDFSPLESADSVKTSCTSPARRYLVLVYQPERSTIGRDTLLGLLIWPNVTVRILSDQKLFANFGLSPMMDKLAIIDCVGNSVSLHPTNDTSKAYVASVSQYLYELGYNAVPPLPTIATENVTNYRIDEEQAAIISTVLRGTPRVYRADLEQAIDKLLHIELPKVRIFKGDSLLSLRKLLNALRLFSPLNPSGNLLLNRLYEFVKAIGPGSELTGIAFQIQVQTQERLLPRVFKARRYVGCIASRPFLRGFTCSLWTLFHYLTVQAAKAEVLPPGALVRTIHGFVKHFFGCRDCVWHFLEMAERRRITLVNNRDEEILWLWEAHNEINLRLAGDSTEDPEFPKIQFPSLFACDKCQLDSAQNPTWNRSAVLEYLKYFYDNKNLSYYGLPTAFGYN